VILLLVGILPITILKYWILENYETQALQQRADQIRSQCRVITEELSSTGFLTGSGDESARILIEGETSRLGSLYSGRVVVVNSRFRIVRDTYGIDEGKVLIAQEVLRAFEGEEGKSYDKSNEFMEVTVPVRSTDSGKMAGVMIISVPTTDIRGGRDELGATVYILQIILILLLLGVAFYVAGLLVRPFGKVTASLDENESFLDEDISIPDYTETELLAEAYNRMRRRLRAQEESRQEFVSNVSHELKTPLTSMKVLADSLVTQENVPNEMYREFMLDITEEIDRENKIINDLLSLVKMDRKAPDINIKETNINNLIDLILKRLRPIASKQNIELVLEDYKPILAQVDETKLTLAFTNLIENGIKYNRPDGWVHVSLNMDNSFFFVKVEDSGIGIPEASQQFIFERFYRVDKSHSREIGGTGLGLAITRSAVLMHHGAIRVYSKEGEGTTFTVRIPLRYEQ
jgi:signal transduction histidine kinase